MAKIRVIPKDDEQDFQPESPTKNNSRPHYSYVSFANDGDAFGYAELICDEVADIAFLPSAQNEIAIGSKCFCVSNNTTYRLSNKRRWVPISSDEVGSSALPDASEGDLVVFKNGAWISATLLEVMLENGLYTPNLATDAWSTIDEISASGNAANYYAVGDCKAVALNGTMGTLSLDMTTYVFILGFDHNSAVEGNGISFGGFKTTAGNDAVDICLVDSGFGELTNDGSKMFNMNHWGETGGKGEPISYNHGGWSGSDMRYDILGSTNVAPDDYGELPAEGREGHNPTSTCATNPVANTLMSCLPAALRAVMKPITKYTDNVGGGNGDVEANVTATIDYLPLASEYEVQASNRCANTNEAAHQAQYAYYAAGNSKIKKKHSSTSDAARWWLRSPLRDDSGFFCIVDEGGGALGDFASGSLGVAPLFKV